MKNKHTTKKEKSQLGSIQQSSLTFDMLFPEMDDNNHKNYSQAKPLVDYDYDIDEVMRYQNEIFSKGQYGDGVYKMEVASVEIKENGNIELLFFFSVTEDWHSFEFEITSESKEFELFSRIFNTMNPYGFNGDILVSIKNPAYDVITLIDFTECNDYSIKNAKIDSDGYFIH